MILNKLFSADNVRSFATKSSCPQECVQRRSVQRFSENSLSYFRLVPSRFHPHCLEDPLGGEGIEEIYYLLGEPF